MEHVSSAFLFIMKKRSIHYFGSVSNLGDIETVKSGIYLTPILWSEKYWNPWTGHNWKSFFSEACTAVARKIARSFSFSFLVRIYRIFFSSLSRVHLQTPTLCWATLKSPVIRLCTVQMDLSSFRVFRGLKLCKKVKIKIKSGWMSLCVWDKALMLFDYRLSCLEWIWYDCNGRFVIFKYFKSFKGMNRYIFN